MDEYQSIAPYYERLLGKALHAARRDIRTFIHYHGHKRIVDVCCGTGRLLEMLAGDDMDLYGIDISPSMVKKAQQDMGIHYMVANALEVELAENDFDAVILTFALHEKNELDRNLLLKRCWKLVRPGGHLVVGDYSRIPQTVKGFFWGKVFIPVLERLAGGAHYRNYRSWMEHGALESLLDTIQVRRSIISSHFGETVTLYGLARELYEKQVFLQLDKTVRSEILS